MSGIGDAVHVAISVDSGRIFGEYKLAFEFRHLPKECHLSCRVSKVHGRKAYLTHKEGGFPTGRRS